MVERRTALGGSLEPLDHQREAIVRRGGVLACLHAQREREAVLAAPITGRHLLTSLAELHGLDGHGFTLRRRRGALDLVQDLAELCIKAGGVLPWGSRCVRARVDVVQSRGAARRQRARESDRGAKSSV